jgi:hypothetical protein
VDTRLAEEARSFRRRAEEEVTAARQIAAFALISGIDLGEALASSGEERRVIILRVERLLERERLKGARRHWSYDLNRHIALKQALDRLRPAAADRKLGARERAVARRKRRPKAPRQDIVQAGS